MSKNIAYGVRWVVEVVALPLGAGPMSIADQQILKLSQSSPTAALAQGTGMITVSSTGDVPLSGNISTAMALVGTNAALAFNNPPALAQVQGFNSGGG